MAARQPIFESDAKEIGRVEAFSDGVFGIAMTLLVLDIKVPPPGNGPSLAEALLRQWPGYLSYVTTFLTVLIMWMNHHKLFRHIHRVNHPFLVLNGLLLMGVTLVPFPTALLAAYIGHAGERTAAAFVLAFLNVAVSVGLCFALAVFFAVPERSARR